MITIEWGWTRQSPPPFRQRAAARREKHEEGPRAAAAEDVRARRTPPPPPTPPPNLSPPAPLFLRSGRRPNPHRTLPSPLPSCHRVTLLGGGQRVVGWRAGVVRGPCRRPLASGLSAPPPGCADREGPLPRACRNATARRATRTGPVCPTDPISTPSFLMRRARPPPNSCSSCCCCRRLAWRDLHCSGGGRRGPPPRGAPHAPPRGGGGRQAPAPP